MLRLNGRKKNYKKHLWELLDDLLRSWSVYKYCINSACVLGKDFTHFF